MKYISPEVELKVLMAVDVITASQSGSQGGVDEDGDSTLGKDEF